MIEIDDLITFSNIWFYIAFISVSFFGIIDLIIYNKIRESNITKQNALRYFVLLCVFYFTDLSIYIIAIRKCPHTFISYFFSIYLPLPALLLIAITSIFAAFSIINKYKWKIQSICAYLPYSFLLIGIKVSFALAYGSLCAVIWILTDFVFSLCKMFSLTEVYELYYEKKYD